MSEKEFNLFSMSTDEMTDTAIADEKVSKLEPGMLVDIYDDYLYGEEFEGTALLLEYECDITDGCEQWVVRFEGKHLPVRRYVNPKTAFPKPSLLALLTRYRDMYNMIQPALTDLENLKQAVKDKAMELGENMEIEGAKVELRNGYERTSWDGKLLEGLALVYPAIDKCKKVTEVKASAAVTVK